MKKKNRWPRWLRIFYVEWLYNLEKIIFPFPEKFDKKAWEEKEKRGYW